MRHGLKALLVGALFAFVGQASATIYAFEADAVWWRGDRGGGGAPYCDDICFANFQAATGVAATAVQGPGTLRFFINETPSNLDPGNAAMFGANWSASIGNWTGVQGGGLLVRLRYGNEDWLQFGGDGYSQFAGPNVMGPEFSIRALAENAGLFRGSNFGFPEPMGMVYSTDPTSPWRIIFDPLRLRWVPEPGTLALLSLGLFGLGMTRRRSAH